MEILLYILFDSISFAGAQVPAVARITDGGVVRNGK
jgi:hypothetical protein